MVFEMKIGLLKLYIPIIGHGPTSSASGWRQVWFGLVAGCCVNMVMNLAVK
jgi:hypothetical protein